MRTLILTLILTLNFYGTATAGPFGYSDKPLSEVEKDWIRKALGLPESTLIALAKSKALPAADPLKLYIPAEVPEGQREEVLRWVDRWNEREGMKYGRLKVVTDISEADVIGMLIMIRPNIPAGDVFGFAIPYLITRNAEGFDVIWRGEGSWDRDVLFNELKKRMKARARAHKK